jgi:argininosuccinate lyase
MWGGRFTQKLDPAAWALNTSLAVDRRMGMQDVQGSLAWAAALHQAGVLSEDEAAQIASGLQAIQAEFTAQSFTFSPDDEDIHSAVERRLFELCGQLAGKLHTGRSRNDQVATDFRLWMLQTLPDIENALLQLQNTLVFQAEQSQVTIMPGYTHLQRAQPILLSHWWLAHFWPLQRDRERLAQLAQRAAVLPLGCGALAGTPLPVDRQALAKALAFQTAAPNSIDAVSDRDFAAEFLFFAALCGVHLSKLSEAIVLFCSAEFGFFELSDAFSTGSSLMPQKKNPDIFELGRGKAGAFTGRLVSLLTTLKGLPSTYDKDLQEDKEPVFASADTLLALLPALAGAIQTITAHPERMLSAIDAGMMATDLADYLVRKGVPFRETHALAGKAVHAAYEQGLGLDGLPLAVYRSIHPAFEEDVYQVFDAWESVKRRTALGGTAPAAVQVQLAQAKESVQRKLLF